MAHRPHLKTGVGTDLPPPPPSPPPLSLPLQSPHKAAVDQRLLATLLSDRKDAHCLRVAVQLSPPSSPTGSPVIGPGSDRTHQLLFVSRNITQRHPVARLGSPKFLHDSDTAGSTINSRVFFFSPPPFHPVCWRGRFASLSTASRRRRLNIYCE